MCSDIIRVFAAFSILAVAAGSCGTSGKISKIAKAGVDISLSVPQDEEKEDCDEGQRHDGAREEVEKYLQEDGGMIRYTFHETDGKSSILAVIVPASFVCRDISFMDVSGFPCYRVSVEKLEQL